MALHPVIEVLLLTVWVDNIYSSIYNHRDINKISIRAHRVFIFLWSVTSQAAKINVNKLYIPSKNVQFHHHIKTFLALYIQNGVLQYFNISYQNLNPAGLHFVLVVS